jgi:glycosyltransferase involved in cell wall biosynthesis
VRAVLLNQYFWPDLSAAAQLMADLAEDLVATGVDVTVLAGRHTSTGGGALAPREEWNGVQIRRLPTPALGRERLWRRAVDHAAFLAGASARLLAEREIDVVVTASTPPFLPVAGALRRRMRGTRFVQWALDLYPDVAIELGLLGRESWRSHQLERISRRSFADADVIIAIGDCMAERIAAKGISPDRIRVIHNWADGDEIVPVAHQDNWFRRAHDLVDRFVVLYSGNMGRGHTFDALVAAARQLAGRSDIVFLFVGGGPQRREVERDTAGLRGVRFLPQQPREHLAFSLGAADLAVVTLRDESLGVMVPSKLYGHLASARPILFIGPDRSTTARVVQSAGCGQVFGTRDSAGVANFIAALAADRALARALGQASRWVFEERFTRPHSVNQLIEAIAPDRPRSSER